MKLMQFTTLLCGWALAAACGAGPDDPFAAGAPSEATAEDELTATPTGPAQQAVPAPVLPDLLVGSFAVTAPATLRCGTQQLSFTALETNAGRARAGTHFLHLQRLNTSNGQWVGVVGMQLPAIAAGATAPLAGTFTFWNGPCDCLPTSYSISFRLFIDGGDAIAESNEANNASNVVIVPATCP